MATMPNEATFYIPETPELLNAGLNPADIERMVLDLADDPKVAAAWGYNLNEVTSASGTAVLGTYNLAAAAGLPLDDALNNPYWRKTIWRRACFKNGF